MNGDGTALNDWTDAVSKLGGTAGGILGALRGKSNTPAAAPAAAASSPPWGMIAAIGAAVVLVFVVLLGSRK